MALGGWSGSPGNPTEHGAPPGRLACGNVWSRSSRREVPLVATRVTDTWSDIPLNRQIAEAWGAQQVACTSTSPAEHQTPPPTACSSPFSLANLQPLTGLCSALLTGRHQRWPYCASLILPDTRSVILPRIPSFRRPSTVSLYSITTALRSFKGSLRRRLPPRLPSPKHGLLRNPDSQRLPRQP